MTRTSTDLDSPVHATSRPRARVGAWALVAPVLLAACAQTPASPPGEAGVDGRMAVIRGTTTGITLLPARTPRAAPAPSSAPSAGAEGTAPAAGAAAGTTRWLSELIESLPPPSGRPLVQQKKLDAPDQGIPLPTAATGSGSSR